MNCYKPDGTPLGFHGGNMFTLWILMALCVGGTLGFMLCAVLGLSSDVEPKKQALSSSMLPMDSDSHM